MRGSRVQFHTADYLMSSARSRQLPRVWGGGLLARAIIDIPCRRPPPSSLSSVQPLANPCDEGGGERDGGIAVLLLPPSTDTRACNVGVEYVSFFNCYASNVFRYFHHPYSLSSSLTPPLTPFLSNMSGEIPPMAAIPSYPSSASAASLSSSSL